MSVSFRAQLSGMRDWLFPRRCLRKQLLCFGDKEIDPGGHGVAWRGKGVRCPLCKGTGVQSPETVRAYKHGELNLDLLVTLA